jgi:hypothetical protein
MQSLPDEWFITNPVPRSLQPSVVQAPRAVGSHQDSLADVRDAAEELKLVHQVHLAVLSLLSLVDLPRAQSEAKEALLGLLQGRDARDAWKVAEQIRTGLDDIARGTDRCFVLRLTNVEALPKKQLAILGRMISRADETSARIRFVVSGLPGAVATLLHHVNPGTKVTTLGLDWKLDATERSEAVAHIVELTRNSEVPFPASAAERVFDAADGIKSLINDIGGLRVLIALPLMCTVQRVGSHDGGLTS